MAPFWHSIAERDRLQFNIGLYSVPILASGARDFDKFRVLNDLLRNFQAPDQSPCALLKIH